MRMKPTIAIGIALTFTATTGLVQKSAVSERTVPIQYVTAGAGSFGKFFGCKGRSAAVAGAAAVTRLRLEIVPNLEAAWTPSTEVLQRALTPMDAVCTDFASTDVTPITPTALVERNARSPEAMQRVVKSPGVAVKECGSSLTQEQKQRLTGLVCSCVSSRHRPLGRSDRCNRSGQTSGVVPSVTFRASHHNERSSGVVQPSLPLIWEIAYE
jgi:hypothetical protein